MVAIIIKLFKYEINAILEAIDFYTDVFRKDYTKNYTIEFLQEVKKKMGGWFYD